MRAHEEREEERIENSGSTVVRYTLDISDPKSIENFLDFIQKLDEDGNEDGSA